MRPPAGSSCSTHRRRATSTGRGELGSEAILRAIEEKRPSVAICGHFHEDGGKADRIGPTRLYNVGPAGTFIDL